VVAGEAAIIADPNTPTAEAYARLKLLKLISYYSKYYDWVIVRDFFGAALASVERSPTLSWDSINYSELAATILFIPTRATGTTGGPGYSKDRTVKYFCSAYNHGTCRHTGGHKGFVGGRERWLDHFCAQCYLKAREVNKHPECSDACPRRNRRRGSRKGSQRRSSNSDKKHRNSS
jgi:hypothetical protein